MLVDVAVVCRFGANHVPANTAGTKTSSPASADGASPVVLPRAELA